MLGLNPLASAPLGDLGVKNVALSGTSVSTGSPTVAEGVLSQLEVSAGESVITQNPVIDTTAISQNHSLDATYNGNGASVPNGTMFEDESFSAPNVLTGTVRIGTGVLTENHDLQAPDVTTQNATVDNTSITQVSNLSSADISTGAPTLSSTAATQTFTVTVVGGNPSDHPYYNVGSSNKYAIDGSTATADVALSLIEGRTYRFDQSDSSNDGHPLRFSTTANGTHASGSEYTTGVTVVGTAGQSGAYTEIAVAVGAPQLYYYCSNHSNMGWSADTDANTTIAITQVHNLTVGNLETGSVSIASTAITQVHNVAASDVTFGVPTVASSAISQIHTLAAPDLDTGAGDVATSAITQIHDIATDNVTSGSVSLPTIDLTEDHKFSSSDITLGAPSVATTVITQDHSFSSADINFGNPVIDSVAASIIYNFSGDDVLAGAVSIDSTGITVNHVLLSNNVITLPVSVDSTVITQDHKLASLELVTGNVSIPLARFPFMAITTPPESYTDLSVGAESWSDTTAPDTDTWPDAVAASTPTFTETTDVESETWTDAA